jgi:hypothetical protein
MEITFFSRVILTLSILAVSSDPSWIRVTKKKRRGGSLPKNVSAAGMDLP